jgi:uncharacterized membrane protein
MDASHNDLEAIRRLLADLTTRVSEIERRLGAEGKLPPSSTSAEAAPITDTPAMPVLSATAKETHQQRIAPYPIVPNASSRPVPGQSVSSQTRPLSAKETDLESRIGSHWLNRIGIAALLIGTAYFLKFAFDNNWIGPAGRVAIGLFAGVAVTAWSERFRSRSYLAFSYSLKAVGIGALYLSLWAAFQVYSLVPSSIAFVAMFIVTAATAGMSWAQDSQLLAAFALAGGFSTPLLLATGENHELALFAYLSLLDLWILALVALKSWLRLEAMSFIGTILLYLAWYTRFYDPTRLGLTIVFATLFFGIFAMTPLIALRSQRKVLATGSMGSIVAFLNGVVYFVAAYAMIAEIDKDYMAGFALALAGVYIILYLQIDKQVSGIGAPTLPYIHLAIAVGLITVAIPIRLDGHWITIGWFVEAGALVWVADRIHSDLLNAFALGALGLGVIRLLLIDNFYTTQLFFNSRLSTYAVAVAVLATVAFYNAKRNDDAGRTVAAIAVIALNLLTLLALSWEVADYYNRQLASVRSPFIRSSASLRDEWRRLAIERDFTYSALWMAYGAMLMAVGFAHRSALVRWQALVLIAVTIVKVFVYDVSQLDREYRIISFIVLGALLLAISFLYQRDWLRLSATGHASQAGLSDQRPGP